MKTAMDVIEEINRRIESMRAEAVGPCIDALLEWSDREAYREAIRKATSLKAIEHLRDSLIDALDVVSDSSVPATTPRRRRASKA